jgi:hypothetical protein
LSLATILRAIAEKLEPTKKQVVSVVPEPPETDAELEPMAMPYPVVVLSKEAEDMLAEADKRVTVAAKETDAPLIGSACYRMLVATARRESGQ